MASPWLGPRDAQTAGIPCRISAMTQPAVAETHEQLDRGSPSGDLDTALGRSWFATISSASARLVIPSVKASSILLQGTGAAARVRTKLRHGLLEFHLSAQIKMLHHGSPGKSTIT